jgi:hypothetical protein
MLKSVSNQSRSRQEDDLIKICAASGILPGFMLKFSLRTKKFIEKPIQPSGC